MKFNVTHEWQAFRYPLFILHSVFLLAVGSMKSSKLYLKPADKSWLGRLVNNVMGSVMGELLDKIQRIGGMKQDI